VDHLRSKTRWHSVYLASGTRPSRRSTRNGHGTRAAREKLAPGASVAGRHWQGRNLYHYGQRIIFCWIVSTCTFMVCSFQQALQSTILLLQKSGCSSSAQKQALETIRQVCSPSMCSLLFDCTVIMSCAGVFTSLGISSPNPSTD
jgi:ABC-type multidrug transport system permease subunit